ncbi:ASCH domain-containing protein [Glutamicibacter halophytocola]|uniref:ASCH domain-containing protein n=1 Tax=Glutamicibacter halophytocola TaxID=1933880 RepID=A0ABX5YAN3_9MICC|nr:MULTISPECIES: ASCH domain-containing protein [Glutamicibacter]MBF6670380.1 ASCH domain-containing protein [Glutamicibacter sp. FBE19]QDY66694.1 ASCH domain-containing protein [Glutamicibacter halophytocola]
MTENTVQELPPVNGQAAATMWADYLASRDISEDQAPHHVAESFGDHPALADELLNEILHGTKRATSSLASDYAYYGERVPQPEDHCIICNGAGEPRAILRIISVERASFFEVDEQFAAAEGEGDLSLAYWRREHEKFWRRTQKSIGREWSPEDTQAPGGELILERFEICWPEEYAG